MRNLDISPLKPSDVDLDLHRFTRTNHHSETPMNRKFSFHEIYFFPLGCFFFFLNQT